MDKTRVVTRNDVAKLAGVSPAVVSYILNDSNYVSDAKREAVLKAIEELDYKPNAFARGLKTKRSMQIAFICDNLRNEWMEIPEKLLFEKGYFVSHCYSREDQGFLKTVLARQYDAIFMMSNFFSTSQLNDIAARNIPVVLYKTRNYGALDPKIVTVVPDYYDGVKKSVSYLAMKGHKNIALIPPIRYKTEGIYGNDFRVNAYLEALRERDLPICAEYVCVATQTMDTILNSIFHMLSLRTRPTALVTGNDYMAVQIMQYVKKLGFSIPEDIAILGADNNMVAEITRPTLTTVDFSKELFSEKLVSALLTLINGQIPPEEYVPVSIIVRESA